MSMPPAGYRVQGGYRLRLRCQAPNVPPPGGTFHRCYACCDGGPVCRDGEELAEELVAVAEAQVPGWSKRGRVGPRPRCVSGATAGTARGVVRHTKPQGGERP